MGEKCSKFHAGTVSNQFFRSLVIVFHRIFVMMLQKLYYLDEKQLEVSNSATFVIIFVKDKLIISCILLNFKCESIYATVLVHSFVSK